MHGWLVVLPNRAGVEDIPDSIRVNDRYRICFVWKDGDAEDVEIVDYH
jgi:plasmid maintenance system killer protein